jgi:hypothetical protein
MNLHKIFSGNPEHRIELILASVFVLVWFAMDLSEWLDWAISKFNPTQSAICIPVSAPTLQPPGTFLPAWQHCVPGPFGSNTMTCDN